MPKFDGTGPMGQGPRTGRGMGPCGGAMKFGQRRTGQGFGSGFGRFFQSPKNQLQSLEDREKMLEEELKVVKQEKEALKNQNE